MTVSAAIRLNGGSAGVKASVSASSTVTGTLDSITGVRSVEWLIASTDETSEPSDYTLLQSGIVGETVTFTALGAGTAGILFSRVNNGIDPVTGNYSTAMTSTAKFYVPASANGFEVGCVNETFESDPTFGSTGEINTGIRNAAPIAGVPSARQVIAGAGLTGGGDLSADRTFNVVANADGSITVNANDIQVGVLASDVQHGNLGGGNLHDVVIASGAAGFMSGTDKAKLDGVGAAAPPGTRTLTAGAGLTGGGDLSANRTFDVVANADGSIVVNANDIQVGILATDAQHGNRGGGGIHANVVASGAAGFMTGADKAKLDGITSGAAVASVSGTAPIISSGGTTPAISISAASGVAAGSMSSTHFNDLTNATDAATASRIVKRDASADASLHILNATNSVNIKDSGTNKLTLGPYSSGDVETPLTSADSTPMSPQTPVRFRNSAISIVPFPQGSSTSITLDGVRGNLFDVDNLVDNVTFAAPTGFDTTGWPFIEIFIKQGAGAPHTISWNAVFVFPTGISSAAIGNDAGEVDYYRFQFRSTYWVCTIHNQHVAP